MPFHNKKIWDGILKWAAEYKNQLQGVYMLGDIADCNSLSSHERGMMPIPGITLDWEYKETNKELDRLDGITRGIQKYYLWGNHEDRYNRTMQQVDNFKYGTALLSPTDGLRLRERGYKVKEDWKQDCFKIGKHLEGIHGWYLTKYPARKHLVELKTSCIFPHTHRMDMAVDRDQAAFNIGWLGDVKAPVFKYASRITKLNWVEGFAVVTLDTRGYYYTQMIQCYKDCFYYNGKKYGG